MNNSFIPSHMSEKRRMLFWSIEEQVLFKQLFEKYGTDFKRYEKYYDGRNKI